MMSMSWMTPLLVLSLFWGGCASWKKFGYEGWGRDRDQQPARVMAALAVAPGAHVADLGAGGGYFTFRFADAVGADGLVYAVDVDPDMLGYLREQVRERGLANVEVITAAAADPGLPADGVDLLFTCNTYHHLTDRSAYFRRLKPSLRSGARVAIIDHDGSGFFGWLFGHATPPATIRGEMEAAGYRLEAQYDFLSRQSFQVFVPA
jgi:predicted methyltransferase